MRIFLFSLLVLIISPVIAFAAFKPSRILYPEINNVECIESICLEDVHRYDEAKALVQRGRKIVSESFGNTGYESRVVFCSTEHCFNSFALRRAKGITVGYFGSVINAHGWQEDIVAHEMIHQWQNNHFGLLTVFLAEPWFIEGMAFSLSRDTHNPLPEPWASYKSQYEQWQNTIGHVDLVTAIEIELQSN